MYRSLIPGALTLALACVAGCSGSSRTLDERCRAMCARVERVCSITGCTSACDALAAAGPGCATTGDAYVSCLESAPDAQLCSATSGGGSCNDESQALAVCAMGSTAMCQPFGTCARDASMIETCVDHGVYEYRTGTRTFPCASMSDCSAAQNDLLAYCGP